MAGEAKITKKVIDEVSEAFSNLDEKELARVADLVGQDFDFVKQVQNKPSSNQSREFIKSLIEKTKGGAKTAKEMIDGAQSLFDQVMGRAPRADEDLTAIGKTAAQKTGGDRPPGFEPSEAKFVGEGGRRRIPKPMPKDVNYTLGIANFGEPGGPLVPVAQPGRLQTVADKLQAEASTSSSTALVPIGPRFDRRVASPSEIAEAASKAKPGAAGRGVSEVTPESKTNIAKAGRTEAERAADFNLDIKGLPSERAVEAGAKALKAGKYTLGGTAGLGLGLAGKMLFDKGFSGEEAAPPVVKESGVEDTEDVKTVVATIPEGSIAPEQKAAIEGNIKSLGSAMRAFEEKTLGQELAAARKEQLLKEGRLEFMRALETIMHGVVSALGANAMLNRNSPFAIDFSQGPKTDWASEFDRLQKSYDSQIKSIEKRYELALEEKKAQKAEARAARGEAREERKLTLQEQKIKQDSERRREEALLKLSTADQETYKDNLRHYGNLRRAIADKKLGPAESAAAQLGASPETLTSLKEALNQGLWDKALTMLGLSSEPTVEEVLQGLRPQKPVARPTPEADDSAAPAAPAAQLPSAIKTPDKGTINRTTETDAQWKAFIDAVEKHWTEQNKSIERIF